MKIVYTNHAEQKFIITKKLGWEITKKQVIAVIAKPQWIGTSPYGQETRMGLVDTNHILRVVINKEDAIIKIVTLHVTRRGRYESTL